ncbi:hypothetical protein V7S43_000825 [Phytophthora oleae]|uniref:Uncharacterized protein n=1 Tax=Phytophthora oleae TaxID=2107226 RepID=A0ABD3GCJ7_9STRA
MNVMRMETIPSLPVGSLAQLIVDWYDSHLLPMTGSKTNGNLPLVFACTRAPNVYPEKGDLSWQDSRKGLQVAVQAALQQQRRDFCCSNTVSMYFCVKCT